MASLLMMNTSILNKGDALMNEAILRAFGPEHDWSVTSSLAQRNPAETKKFGIYLDSDRAAGSSKQKVFNRAVRIAAKAAAVLPGKLRRRVRVRLSKDIDAALDVSGYCFGDHWGQARVDLHTENYRRLRQAGAKVVLMPKTWGPFEEISHSSLNEMFRYVDLAFARDYRSESAIRSILTSENGDKLFFAPDYTHGVVVDPISIAPGKRIAYLVPSRRVIDSGTMTQTAYYDLFAKARNQLQETGLSPYLLIHETSNDLRFIRDAGEMGFTGDQVVVADSAVHAKSLIAAAELVITSRLHGLYNALNSAVPVIAVAWSYKYVEALKQYGCTDNLVDISQAKLSMRDLIERLAINPAQRAAAQDAMREGKARSAERSAAMWQQIKALIG
jgi:colanic acid/amylovoran biosynthesis protein